VIHGFVGMTAGRWDEYKTHSPWLEGPFGLL
jgi:hypothetical protein